VWSFSLLVGINIEIRTTLECVQGCECTQNAQSTLNLLEMLGLVVIAIDALLVFPMFHYRALPIG
jgi:hypothetical protein